MIGDLGLLTARLALGLGLASHGAQKALGWFDGPGPEKAAGFMDSLGFKPGATYASAAAWTEIGSGLAIALGAGGPLGPAGVFSTMLVAAQSVHAKNGFFSGKNGVELNVLYAAGALALASSGYGGASVDRMLGLDEKLRNPALVAVVLAGGLVSAWAILGARDTSPPAGTLATPTIPGVRNGAATPAPAPSA